MSWKLMWHYQTPTQKFDFFCLIVSFFIRKLYMQVITGITSLQKTKRGQKKTIPFLKNDQSQLIFVITFQTYMIFFKNPTKHNSGKFFESVWYKVLPHISSICAQFSPAYLSSSSSDLHLLFHQFRCSIFFVCQDVPAVAQSWFPRAQELIPACSFANDSWIHAADEGVAKSIG